jgi:hypothetical protein
MPEILYKDLTYTIVGAATLVKDLPLVPRVENPLVTGRAQPGRPGLGSFG